MTARLPIVGTRRTTVTSLMVLLAIITPVSSGTRRPSLADRAILPVLSAGPMAAVFRGTGGNEPGDGDVQTPAERYGDAVLVASEVFEGIDLIVRPAGDDPAYGFVVRPNARPDRIRLSMPGGDRLQIDEQGDLLVHRGGRLVRQRKLRAHQETPGGRVEIRADYRVGPDGDVRLAVGPYDRSRALVIHP